MTKSTTTQKVILGIFVGLIVVAIGAFVVQNQIEESDLQRATAQAHATAMARRSNDEMQQLKVKSVSTFQGDVAASILKACYAEGYPTGGVTNALDAYPPPRMSRRRVAECDRVLKRQGELERQFDAKERRKDAEYDRAHSAAKK